MRASLTPAPVFKLWDKTGRQKAAFGGPTLSWTVLGLVPGKPQAAVDVLSCIDAKFRYKFKFVLHSDTFGATIGQQEFPAGAWNPMDASGGRSALSRDP